MDRINLKWAGLNSNHVPHVKKLKIQIKIFHTISLPWLVKSIGHACIYCLLVLNLLAEVFSSIYFCHKYYIEWQSNNIWYDYSFDIKCYCHCWLSWKTFRLHWTKAFDLEVHYFVFSMLVLNGQANSLSRLCSGYKLMLGVSQTLTK